MTETPLQLPPPSQGKTSLSATVKILLFLVFIALSCGIGAIVWVFSGQERLEQGVVQGTLVPIMAPLTTKITEVFVHKDARVEQGKLLARLDALPYAKHLDDARALVRTSLRGSAYPEDAQFREKLAHQIATARFAEENVRESYAQSSVEHAKALLRVRELDAQNMARTSATYLKARQAMRQSELEKERLNNLLSEVHNVRIDFERDLKKLGQGMLDVVDLTSSPPTDVLIAPVGGKIHGELHVGQKIYKDTPVVHIAILQPDHTGIIAYATAAQIQKLAPGQICSVTSASPHKKLWGRISALPQSAAAPQPHVPGAPAQEQDKTGPLLPIHIEIADASKDLAADSPVSVTVWRHDMLGLQTVLRVLQ